MLEKNPETVVLFQATGMLAVALLGGVVSYLKKLQRNGKEWKLFDLTIELTTAGFAGLVTYFLCQWVGIGVMGTAALTGISGHFSAKAIEAFGKILDKFLCRLGK